MKELMEYPARCKCWDSKCILLFIFTLPDKIYASSQSGFKTTPQPDLDHTFDLTAVTAVPFPVAIDAVVAVLIIVVVVVVVAAGTFSAIFSVVSVSATLLTFFLAPSSSVPFLLLPPTRARCVELSELKIELLRLRLRLLLL